MTAAADNGETVSPLAAMQTEVIRYNLRDRGRQFRGKERNFDVPRIVATVNGGACQEKVRHRDMFGYFGHWPRVKFGMNPSEGGLVDGKQVAVEPALVTISLKAFDDGTIEHQAEFLDTNAGRLAQRLYASKAGGFSSAIDELRPEFYGFDYVLEPNYTKNRGYDLALDGVLGTFDAVEAVAEYQEQIAGIGKLLDCVQQDRDRAVGDLERALSVVGRMEAEIVQLQSMLMKKGQPVTLDSIGTLESVMPIVMDSDATHRLQRTIQGFRTAVLARIDEPKQAEEPALKGFMSRLLGR